MEDILQTYDRERRVLPPPVRMWEWGWTKSAETWNGRIASEPPTCPLSSRQAGYRLSLDILLVCVQGLWAPSQVQRRPCCHHGCPSFVLKDRRCQAFPAISCWVVWVGL